MNMQMSQEKFQALEADLHHNKAIKDFKETSSDGLNGVITTHDVVISFSYNPVTQVLSYEIGKRLSLAARVASDNMIYNHITDLLSTLDPKPEDKSVGYTLSAPKTDAPVIQPSVNNVKNEVNKSVDPKPTEESKKININDFKKDVSVQKVSNDPNPIVNKEPVAS